SRRRHTRWPRDWSSDVCSSDLKIPAGAEKPGRLDAASLRPPHRLSGEPTSRLITYWFSNGQKEYPRDSPTNPNLLLDFGTIRFEKECTGFGRLCSPDVAALQRA